MNVNKQAYSNLYQAKLSFIYTIQTILYILTFVCLTSIYLFGTSTLFSDDVAYFFIIVLLSILAFFKKYTIRFFHLLIRPKISIGVFQNITSILTLVFSAICLTLLAINTPNNEIFYSFGLFESITFSVGLPILFFSWLMFEKTNLKVNVLASGNYSQSGYSDLSTYIIIILIALFGIVFDFLPQNPKVLIWIPLLLLVSISFINIITNHFQIKWVLKAITKNTNEDIHDDYYTTVIYETDPYTFEKNIETNLIEANGDQRISILNTLKYLVAIDFIPVLISLRDSYNMDKESYSHLNETLDYLQSVNIKVSEIKNKYEFVEQSNDLTLIKGLLRTQIVSDDKNLIIKLLNDNRKAVKKSACIVAGYHDDINFISILIDHLGKFELSIWAQFALKNIGFKSVKYLEIEFSKQKANLFFVEACFEVLSEIKEPRAHDTLYNALNESNKNIKLIAAKKIISRIESPDASKRFFFSNIFDELIINLITNLFLIREVNKKNETFYQLRQALKNENKENIFLIEKLIKLYYNKSAVKLLFSFYGTENMGEHAFSNHIIDLLFSGDYLLRNKVKILFSPNDSRLIESLEEEFPNVELSKQYKDEESLIWSILEKDYDRINNWTRACAIYTLQNVYSEDIPFELTAEFLNDDQLMKETAAICIYKNVPEFYAIFLKRLPKSVATKLDFTVRSNVDYTSKELLREDNLLLFDKIQFLMSIPYLNELTINEINTFEPFFKVKLLKEGDHTISVNDDELTGYWIIENGQVNYSANGTTYDTYLRRDILEVMPYTSISSKVYVSLSKPARILLVEKIVLLNILKYSREIILNKIGEKSDFYPNLAIENKLKGQLA